MAGNIKGLTVEIGGDTTKLGKALADVNKKSKSLSSELGEINKLLKFDPGNADLLAQKQQVLADAISNTAKKLETLEEAERQVQEQFERGEVSEEQVRALQREIIATTKKLNGYEKAAEETVDAINQLGNDSDEAADDIKDTDKAADKAADSLDDMADSAEKAGDAGESMGAKLGNAAKAGLAAIGAAATAVVGALVGAAESSREYRTEMGKLDTAFISAGHSSQAAYKTYSSLQSVLGETDQAVEAANHLAKLTDNEEDLAKWTDACTGIYATFGASLPIEGLTEAANETAKLGQLTGPLADALNWAGVNEEEFQASLDACSDEQERQALILETLNGLYGEAAATYKETNAEVIRANQANEEWASVMADVGAAVEPVLTDVKLLGASLLADLVPGVEKAVEAFRGILNGDEGAAEGLGAAISGIITQVLDTIVYMAPTITEVALGLITTLTTSLLNSAPLILQTLISVAGQVIGSLVTYLPQLMVTLVTSLVNSVTSILQAVTTEVLPQLVTLIGTTLPQVVTSLVSTLGSLLPQLISGALQFFLGLLEALKQTIPLLLAELPNLVSSTVSALVEAVPLLLDAAIVLFMAIVDSLPFIIQSLTAALPNLIDTITTTVIEATPLLLDAAIEFLMAIIDAIPIIIQLLLVELPNIIRTITGSLLKNLPLLLSTAVQLFMQIVAAIPKFLPQLVAQIPSICKAILSGLTSGLSGIGNIGKNLIQGLWNGISNMTGWIISKIRGFGSSVLGGLKSFFGIASPSKVLRDEVGKMLGFGLAEGIEDSTSAPVKAMASLSEGVLDEAAEFNGMTLENQLQSTFAAAGPTGGESGLFGRLDKILSAIERGQIITIDGDAWVGATADRMDRALGYRRTLAARGAI